MVDQGEIVFVPFRLSDGEVIDHPALVVSQNLTDFGDDIFYAVLISTKNHHDEYTIEISDEMLTSPLKEKSYFVTHQLDKFVYKEIHGIDTRTKRFVKDEYIEGILNKVIETIFDMK
ncbi:MAG: type II toxin-antitoxin system PemK/MazF family toxin [Bacteroidales bacterium]|nr:type II toxin-antitoxin system PemK/MazF family toxin [Bacteroidales bacterium]